ncbi:MAG: AmmeMemoRadiSam system radical SAM enzyme [Acidobacteria bacterium]|nr:AmmeMemoRadiSam system radical SAM enzyme [Acidobacteriota bacterium]
MPEAPARWWRAEGDKALCWLCPRYCRIGEGQSGFCFIRANHGGRLVSLGYGRPAALQVDPIEKKPLNHFLPGTSVLSLGTAGCNMGCKFCQNWDISKSRQDQVRSIPLSPDAVVERAVDLGCPSIAFTYNEPTILAEYAIDISRVARERGVKTVMVTNGYVTLEALPEVYEFIDAANVDLKAFTEEFYRKVTLTHIGPVLDALVELKRRGVWIEITNLVIPTLNDAVAETRALAGWILRHLGDEVPLHFTAFHPDFKLEDLPRTPQATIEAARLEALSLGLKHVYVGNVHSDEGSTTVCPGCGDAVIRRSWHRVTAIRLRDGSCRCGRSIPGVFSPLPSSPVMR